MRRKNGKLLSDLVSISRSHDWKILLYQSRDYSVDKIIKLPFLFLYLYQK